jgi:hypothetical protein
MQQPFARIESNTCTFDFRNNRCHKTSLLIKKRWIPSLALAGTAIPGSMQGSFGSFRLKLIDDSCSCRCDVLRQVDGASASLPFPI